MPISRASFLRFTLMFLFVGLAALVAVVGTTVWLVNRTQDYAADIAATRQFRSAAADTLSVLQDAETGQRGFIITGDSNYLEPFERARAQFQDRLAALKQAEPDWADVGSSFDRLAQVATGKMAELAQTVELRRADATAQVVDIVRAGGGKALMDEARSILDSFMRLADDHLGAVVGSQRANANALWWVSVIGGLLILTVTGISTFIVQRYTQEIIEARDEVESLNAGLEERVHERTAELARANEEIQRFAYIVTHDLRAPLVNIMGFTSELETSLVPLQSYVASAPRAEDPAFEEARRAAEEDVPEALGFIRSSTRKMDGLINAILRLSREGKRVLRPEAIDIAALVANSVTAIGHQLVEADGKVAVDINVPRVTTDRLSLEQVIGNLLDNAVKYRRASEPLRISVRGRREGATRFRLEVEDNSRGIAPQDLERVFELFRRSGQQDQAGEGIGLAHVRTLVRNLGGEIGLRSTLGQGSTFSIVLPLDLRTVTGSVAA